MTLLFNCAMAVIIVSANATARQNMAVAKKVASAIKGKTDFQPSDFIRPLAASDKVALRKFGRCRIQYMSHPGLMNTHGELVRDPNEVAFTYACKKVPWDMPAGISLYFKEGKIAKVETHNADLLRDD